MLSKYHLPAENVFSYVLIAYIASAGIFYITALPGIVTALVDGLGFSDQQAGYASSANAYGSMTGALLAVALVRRWGWKKAVGWMFVLMTALELCSTQISSPTLMAGVRFFSGLVGGCSVGFGLAILARTAHPDRGFGTLFLLQFGLGGLLILLRPLVIPYIGVTGIFVMLALLILVGLAVLPFLSDYSAEETEHSRGSQLPPLTLFTLLGLAAIFLYQMSGNGMWAFIERVGAALQFKETAVSGAVAVATWAGIAGAFVPIVLGKAIGKTIPLVVGIVMTIAGVLFVHQAEALPGYTIGGAMINFAWSFSLAYLFGISAHYDSTGQLTALAGTASKFGLATGPLVATFLIDDGSYGRLLIAATFGFAAALAVVIAPARRADSE